MLIRDCARFCKVFPRKLATPYSVTTQSTSFLPVVTKAPGASSATIREVLPPRAVIGQAINDMPPGERLAPRTNLLTRPPVPL